MSSPNEMKGAPTRSNKEISKKLNEQLTLKAQIDTLQKDADKLADAVKAELERRGAEEYPTESTRCAWKPVASSRFDSAAFKASHAKMYKNFLKVTETRRFTVTAA